MNTWDFQQQTKCYFTVLSHWWYKEKSSVTAAPSAQPTELRCQLSRRQPSRLAYAVLKLRVAAWPVLLCCSAGSLWRSNVSSVRAPCSKRNCVTVVAFFRRFYNRNSAFFEEVLKFNVESLSNCDVLGNLRQKSDVVEVKKQCRYWYVARIW